MAYTSTDPSDRLAAVRAAIANCLTSQAFTVRGRQQQYAALKDLRAMERELQQEVSDASSSSGAMATLAMPLGVQ